jgi:hypothetical protein
MRRRSPAATFARIDLEPAIHHSRVRRTRADWHTSFARLLASLPTGEQYLYGIPMTFPSGDLAKRIFWLDESAASDSVSITVGDRADYVVVAHFSLPSSEVVDPASEAPVPWRVVLDPGEHLADYILVFDDGTEYRTAIRRRFELSDLTIECGQAAFAARPHGQVHLLDWRGPHDDGRWGRNQMGCEGPSYFCEAPGAADEVANYWLFALPNPRPERTVAAMRFEPITGRIGIGAATLVRASCHPLRYRPRETLRVMLDGVSAGQLVGISVDMGDVGHRRVVVAGDPKAWLGAEPATLGAPAKSESPDLRVDVSANEAATLRVGDRSIPMADIYRDGRGASADGKVRIELMPAASRRIAGRIVDAADGHPTAARIHFHAPDGRYLAPEGHRTEVNDRWFEDFGADLQIGPTAYAYVDGEFEISLPEGDVFVEMVKGFEYRPVRHKLSIEPDQTELLLTLERSTDWRSRGWVTADTHVHFLSPHTAWLEAQAEGINVVNLLAAQWGDMYTNVADVSAAAEGLSRDDTLVSVGTENRQHFLGHMSLLGSRRSPVLPLSAGGPSESSIGDPVWSSLADWADASHQSGGLAIVPHFPAPYCEVVADVALGKVDAVEIADLSPSIETYAMREWYRLLNAGFRVAAVGGTDKMSASIPLGGIRTYARIGAGELSFEAWADAVRAGRTFTTSGPLIELTVDGHGIGDEIRLTGGRGSVDVASVATSQHALTALEVVVNGRVAAREEARGGTHRIRLDSTIQVDADSWVAARCIGPDATYRPAWARWPVSTAAHTSPIYLVGSGSTGERADLAYLITLVDGGLTWLDTLATHADPDHQARLRNTFVTARRELSRRLAG